MAELLNFIVWLPVAGMLAIALIPASQENMVRQVTLWLMILQFVLTAILYVNFDAAATGLQFETRVPWIESWGVNYHIGLDGINVLLVLLTAFLGPLVVAGAFSAITKDVKLFYAMVFFIQFVLYTAFGSILMLAALIYLVWSLQNATGQLSFAFADLYKVKLPVQTQTLLLGAFALSFAIKVPMFPLHTWLPDAHVEAPTAGSVILAGVLLKMGTYGFMKL